MDTWRSVWLSVIAAMCWLAAPVVAQTVQYAENFEAPDAISSQTAGPGGFVQFNNVNQNPGGWQIQGGGGASGVVLTAGVDNNGVGGSQSLFANWDHSPANGSFFTFNQYTLYGIPGFSAGTPESGVTISLDLFISGSESSNTPIQVVFQGNGGAVDRSFTPTLTNGQFTSVSFTLDQATGGAINITQPFNIRLVHGAGGFGFDANNIVRVDNVLVTVVPEPTAAALLALGGIGVWGVALRRQRNSNAR